MTRVALTGGIATGKSYVRQRLADAGVPTIDADDIAREVVAPGTPGLEAIRRHFGDAVLDASGGLDRRALATVVFANPDARRTLEQIVHPKVRVRTDAWLRMKEDTGVPLAVAVIPLLYETGRDRDFDVVIVTSCSPERQLERLLSRDDMSLVEARRRISAQLPTSEKEARATHVIRTDGTFADTDVQVGRILEQLRSG